MLNDLKKGNEVGHLRKDLYGLRQAGRRWHIKLSEEITKFGVIPSKSDSCVFYIGQGEDILLIAVYVEDILAVLRNLGMINKLSKHLSKTFETMSFGDVNYCLGIEFS